MKRIIGTGILVLLLAVTTQAQVRFGLRGGLNAANWQGDATQTLQELVELSNGNVQTQLRPAFHAGVYAAVPLGKRFELEPGLFYSQKGYTATGTFSARNLDFINARATLTDRAHYLDLPVLAKVYVTKGFHVFAGPQLSYLLDNRVRARASVLGFSVLNREINANGGFRKWDAALTGGAGYRFDNGFNVQAGYDYGLSRLDERGNFDTYNRVIKVSVGYQF